MNAISIASGSKGNAYCLSSGRTSVLIDCGLALRELAKRCRQAGVDLGSICAVLVTHAHSDHVKGLKTFLSSYDVPVYANMLTAEAIAGGDDAIPGEAFMCFEDGQQFAVGDFLVEPFSTPHDTADPVGYFVRCGDETYFHGTDIGTPLESIGRRLAEADVAVLESNHDPLMLDMSGRTRCLIERIRGPRGHLSNGQACELVRRYASPRLKRLALAHLSRDCNTPDLAMRAMRGTLEEISRTDIVLSVLSQDEAVVL
ncbi:MAG: MBL fold metallo-hydrolase [Kiritimatiellae bacterium]|nr:MBL fold metallo-hydrolase [Kiritimatiellia bacterium]